MATHNYIVANPKPLSSAAVSVTLATVGGTTSPAVFEGNSLTAVVLDPTTADVANIVAAGLGVINADVITDEDQRKNVGFLFENVEKNIIGGRPA